MKVLDLLHSNILYICIQSEYVVESRHTSISKSLRCEKSITADYKRVEIQRNTFVLESGTYTV